MYTWHQKNAMDLEHPFVMYYNHHSIAFPEHWHEEIEVIYLKKGSAIAKIGDEQFEVSAGDIIFISSKESHSYLSNDNMGDALIFGIGTSFFGDHHDKIANSKFVSPVLRRPANPLAEGDVYAEFERIFSSIIMQMEKKDAGHDLFIRARILDIAWAIISKLAVVPVSHEQKIKRFNKSERLNEVFKFVSKNYQSPIKLETVAKLCNFSSYYFARFFKEAVGMPFCKYLNEYRVKQAKVYLTETENPITEISYLVGFQSIKTFNRVFKTAIGVSPSEFRQTELQRV